MTQDPFGTRFYRGNNADPIVYTKTALEVVEFTFPGITRDVIETTHMESPDAFKEFLPAKLRDGGEFGIKVQITDYDDLAEFVADMNVQTLVNYKCKWPDNGVPDSGADLVFKAAITSIDPPDMAMGNRITTEIKFKVSGKPGFFA